MKVGAQLYTVRTYTQTERDFKDTIEKIAKIGYQTVQISGIGRGIKPEKVRQICDEAGLKNDTERLIEEHNILGCDYIGLGGMPDKYRNAEWLYHFAKDFKEPAKKIAASGKLLMYHNHHFEFNKFAAEGAPDAAPDKRILEYLVDWFTPEELGFTLDTYWVQAAGADVCEWVRKLKDRIPCVHLKDMEMVGNEAVMAPVMQGNLNFSGIFKELENSSCKYMLVEQDTCRTSPFDCLQVSYENLVKAGYR